VLWPPTNATGQSFFLSPNVITQQHTCTPTTNDSVFFTGEICLSLIKLIDGTFCVVLLIDGFPDDVPK
jgi:hypothetical protein